MRDGPRDECGVFGLYAPGHEVSRLSYFALYALQHRGQESAGIAAADRGGHIITRRELGLVNQVFTENDLRTLAGELAKLHGEPLPQSLPDIEIEAVRAAQAAVREAVRAGSLSSAHDIAEGGLAVALAECCLQGGAGAIVDLGGGASGECPLFGEGPGGFVLSGPAEALDELGQAVRVRIIGTVGGGSLRIAGHDLDLSLEQLYEAHGALAELFA